MKLPGQFHVFWALVALLFVGSQVCGCDEDGADEVDAGTDAGDAGGDTDTDTDTNPDFEIDPQRIHDDVAWLADDERGGRKPGTEGNEDALDYVAGLLGELGLDAESEVHFRQPFTYQAWSITGDVTAVIDTTTLDYGTDYQIFSYSGSGNVTAEMVFVGHGMTVPAFSAAAYPDCPLPESGYDDFDGIDVTGKIALVIRHGPDDLESIHDNCPANSACNSTPCLWNFGYKANNAAAHGAVGMLMVNHYQTGGAVEASGTIGEEYYDDDFPSLFVDRSEIEAAIPNLETWSGTIDSTLQPNSQATGVNATIDVSSGVEETGTENLLAVFEGTDPVLKDEVILIGAHIDHLGMDPISGEIFNGADDNATGSAVNMELARAMALSGIQPARTVIIAWWNAEEVGLIGSCYYVDNPSVPTANMIAAYSVDMVGSGNGTGVMVSGGIVSENSWLVDVMSGSAEDKGYDYLVNAGAATQNSDHACFAQAGVPAVMVATLGEHGYYHTPQDTIDKILVDDLAAAAYLMWALLEPVAMGMEDLYTGDKSTAMSFDPRDVDAKDWRNRDL